jgi:hypothetical protein
MQFVEKLQNAVMRQIDNMEAQNVLTLQLTYENANEDCKMAPLKYQNPNIADMISACQNLGT